MLNKIMVGLLVIALLATGFCFGVFYGQETFEPQYIEVEVEVEKIKTVNHYIVQEVEVIKEVEVIVEKPIQLREFTSLKELEEWLAEDRTDGIHLIMRLDGEVEINLDGTPSPNLWTDPLYQDCDDYAVAMQKAAAEDGFIVNIQLNTKKMHALNSVFIGNDIYFVEPQTDKVWFAYHRDKE